MTRHTRRLLAHLSILALVASPVVARADEPAQAARDLDVKNRRAALQPYAATYAADPNPGSLLSLANAERLGGNCTAAVVHYQAILSETDGATAAAADDGLRLCKTALATQDKAAAPDAVRPSPAPNDDRARLAPAYRNTTWYRDVLGDTLSLAGIGAVAVGAVFFAEAYGTSSAATSGLDASWASHRSTAKVESIFGAAFVGVGVGLFGVGQWRYVVVASRGDAEAAPAASSSSVGLGVLRQGLCLSYRGAF
jgi:hypothetical protein